MASNKLLALWDRRYNRDLYDIHFFLTQKYTFDEEIIKDKTLMSLTNFIEYIISEIPNKYHENTVLHQLGEVPGQLNAMYMRKEIVRMSIISTKTNASTVFFRGSWPQTRAG